MLLSIGVLRRDTRGGENKLTIPECGVLLSMGCCVA